MYNVAGTIYLYTLLLGLHTYIHYFWDYTPIYTIAGTTQLHTMLLGLRNNVQFC